MANLFEQNEQSKPRYTYRGTQIELLSNGDRNLSLGQASARELQGKYKGELESLHAGDLEQAYSQIIDLLSIYANGTYTLESLLSSLSQSAQAAKDASVQAIYHNALEEAQELEIF